MPLSKGCTEAAFRANVETLIRQEGKKPAQAVAIAHRVQQEACGVKCFIFGQITADELLDILGDGIVNCSTVLYDFDLTVHGSGRGRVYGLTPYEGRRLLGYSLTLQGREYELLAQAVEPKFKRHSISLHIGRQQPFLMQTFIPAQGKAMEPTVRDREITLNRVHEVLGDCLFEI